MSISRGSQLSGISIDWFPVVGADWIYQASMLISYLGKTDRFPVVRQPARPVREQLFARTVVTRSYLAHMRTVVTRSYDSTECESSTVGSDQHRTVNDRDSRRREIPAPGELFLPGPGPGRVSIFAGNLAGNF